MYLNKNKMWPLRKTNTLINICPQGFNMIVERLGQLHEIKRPGWFFAIPFIDKVRYVVDQREVTIEINPQRTITKDNVQVSVSGNVFIQFNDSEKAAYGCFDPLYAVQQHAQSSMRSAIGRMELDELLHNRSQLNEHVRTSLESAGFDWGLIVRRYELTEITPDKHISEAMDKQAAAERVRREQILGAEGSKKAAVLESEGYRQKIINQAEADAEAIRLNAQATADSINLIGSSLENDLNEKALMVKLSEDLIKMNGEIGSKSNTIFFNDKPADITNLINQAISLTKIK